MFASQGKCVKKLFYLSLIKTEKKYPWMKLLVHSTIVKYQVMQSMICVQVATIAECLMLNQLWSNEADQIMQMS